MGDLLHGSCQCGAVGFRAEGPFRALLACHCSQCRKTSGHFWAASSVPHERFRLLNDDGLAWFRSSARARRGFCRHCGASLFWQPEGAARISFAAGALDGEAGLVVADHWHREDCGDYYSPEGPPPAETAATAATAAPRPLSCSCLCGGVAFALPGPAGPITACHCGQCRKLSGHYAASFDADEAGLAYSARGSLAEYATQRDGRRGFCRNCGSSLWFRAADGAFSVEAGSVDGPTGGRLAAHIFVADKGSHYTIDDGVPQFPGAGG